MSRTSRPTETKIALVQMRCGPEPEKILRSAIEFIREAAKQGAQIVCLPELFRSQYFCQSEDHANFALAEEIPGPIDIDVGESRARSSASSSSRRFSRNASAGVYHNTAAIIDADGKFLGKYRKMHIPDDPAYYEKFYFTPGDLGFQAWPTAHGKIGVCVCWDQWYPEAARLTALRGAQILFYPTAIGWHPAREGEIRRRATFRLGNDAAQSRDREWLLRRGGESRRPRSAGRRRWDRVLGTKFHRARPSGEIIARGSVDREEIVLAEIEWDRVDEQRTHWPFLRDRRIDAYGGLEQRMID